MPQFQSAFLNGICRSLGKRRRAICYSGALKLDVGLHEDFEWLSAHYSCFSLPCVIAQFVEGNRMSLFIRSNTRRNRGKILLAMENVFVVDNPELLVEAFEWTIGQSYSFKEGQPDPALCDTIKRKWNELILRALE